MGVGWDARSHPPVSAREHSAERGDELLAGRSGGRAAAGAECYMPIGADEHRTILVDPVVPGEVSAHVGEVAFGTDRVGGKGNAEARPRIGGRCYPGLAGSPGKQRTSRRATRLVNNTSVAYSAWWVAQ